MKIDQIKKQLESFEKKPKKKEENKPNVYFKPVVGKQVIRLVPNKFDLDGQFQLLKVYYGITHKVMASPSNWGEKDPIEEFIKQLRSQNNKDSWILSKKLEAKTRFFTTVIDRSEGDTAEVKLWQFGKNTWQDFINLADDAEVGDYTDVANGRDIKLNTIGKDQTKTDYNKTTISTSMSVTPLSTDKKMVKYWLENQPNPLDQFKKYSYDEVKEALKAFLTPTEEIGDDEQDVVGEMDKSLIVSAKNKTKDSIAKAIANDPQPVKQSNSDKFKSMFEEEEEEEGEETPF